MGWEGGALRARSRRRGILLARGRYSAATVDRMPILANRTPRPELPRQPASGAAATRGSAQVRSDQPGFQLEATPLGAARNGPGGGLPLQRGLLWLQTLPEGGDVHGGQRCASITRPMGVPTTCRGAARSSVWTGERSHQGSPALSGR